MTDREKFISETRKIPRGQTAYPRKYIYEIKRKIRFLRHYAAHISDDDTRESSNYISDNAARLCDAALSSVSAVRGDRYPMSDGVPAIAVFLRIIIEIGGGKLTTETVYDCLSTRKNGFTVAETAHLYDFFILSVVELIYYSVNAKDEKSAVYFNAYFALKSIKYDWLYDKLTAIHKIYSAEGANIYGICSPDTVRLYDYLTLKYACENKIDEIEAAKRILSDADREKRHIGFILQSGKNTLPFQFAMSVIMLWGLFIFAGIAMHADAGIIIPYALPIYYISLGIVCRAFDTERIRLPRLSDCDAVKNTECLVAVCAVLDSKETATAMANRLEDIYITNRHGNIFPVLLADLPEADTESADGDGAIISTAQSEICRLNKKYGNRFVLFIRRRVYTESERKYIGYERKRGAVLELCRATRGDAAAFYVSVNEKVIFGAKYLMALDSDTEIHCGDVYKLMGAALHPCNKAIIENGRIVSGYGIIQPLIAVSNRSASKTAFASLTAGMPYNRYTADSFGMYNDIFGRGSFCGKGIIDINAYNAVCDGFFPEQRILSHDIIEGELLKTAVDSNTVFADCTPSGSLSYYSRLDRWMRGDTQALMYVFNRVRNGNGKYIKNPLDFLSRYKLADNILRCISDVIAVIILLVGIYANNSASIAAAIIYVFRETFTEIVIDFSKKRRCILKNTAKSFVKDIYRILSLAYRAIVLLKAMVNSVYRITVSHRNLLQWKTSSQADGLYAGCGISAYIVKYFPSFVFGAAAVLSGKAFGIIIGVMWLLFPFAVYCLDSKCKKIERIAIDDKHVLKSYARDMWRYFEDNVSACGLPPDNVQVFHGVKTANRTSPTDIGMYILSMLSARDLGFIGDCEFASLAQKTLTMLDTLPKWHGLFYNWYGTDRTDMLSGFVSSVDNGNLFASLAVFAEGLRGYNVNLIYCNLIEKTEDLLKQMDLHALYDEDCDLFYIGFNTDIGEYTHSHYDILMSEARILGFFAAAYGKVPVQSYIKQARLIIPRSHGKGLYSWSGTAFEYLMPTMILPVYKNSAESDAVNFAIAENIKKSRTVSDTDIRLIGISESCYYRFDSQMTYQYRAFGQSALALDKRKNGNSVFSPYSVFLMLNTSPVGKLKYLDEYRKIGAYGKYGFFDAVDTAYERTGNGYAVIKTFMAHHIGMSIVSCVNAIMNDRFVKRTANIPCVRAFSYLLDEPTPDGVAPYAAEKAMQKRKNELQIKNAFAVKSQLSMHLPQIAAIISNGTTHLAADSFGHIIVKTGHVQWFDCNTDIVGAVCSPVVICYIDGVSVPTVPMYCGDENAVSDFEFYGRKNSVKYVSHNNIYSKNITVSVTFYLGESDALYIECDAKGEFRRCGFRLFFIPVIDTPEAYRAHKSFFDLFIVGGYDSESNSFEFRRRRREGEVPAALKVSCDKADNPIKLSYDRSEILPLKYGIRDVFRAPHNSVSEAERACILPCCLISSAKLMPDNSRATFTVEYTSENRKMPSERRISHKTEHLTSDFGIDAPLYGISSLIVIGVLNRMRFSAFGGLKESADICRLWQYGISGDNPMLACKFGGGMHEIGRLSALVREYSYLTAAGFGLDFVIAVYETDLYNAPFTREVKEIISAAGLSDFIGINNGIFIIRCDAETEALIASVATVFVPLDVSLKRFVSTFGKMPKIKKYMFPTVRHSASIGTNYRNIDGADVTFDKIPHKNPWAHVIALPTFGTVLTENSLGFTFAGNATLEKLTPHDADGFCEDSGEMLILRKYSGTSFEDTDIIASCEKVKYGDMFAEYSGKIDGVSYTVTVDPAGKLPIKRISAVFNEELGNHRLIYRVRPCLGQYPCKSYITEKYVNCVYVKPSLYSGFPLGLCLACDCKSEVITDTISLATDGKFDLCQNDIAALSAFAPNGKCTFLLAAIKTDKFLDYILQNIVKVNNIYHASAYKNDALSIFDCNSSICDSVNYWYYYQTKISRIYARSGFYQVSGAYGFRDQLQDVLALAFDEPDTARVHILRAASHQYPDGTAAHWWHTAPNGAKALRSRFSDDAFWLVFAVCKYIEITDDIGILNINLPFLSSKPLSDGEADRYETVPFTKRREPLMAHLKLAMKSIEKTGEYGLMLFGGGDWNDGMNRVGIGGRGQSVWLTFFASVVSSCMARLASRTGDGQYAQYCRMHAVSLLESAEKHAYYRDRWIRGFYDDGTPFCPSADGVGIDIMAQAFAVFAYKETGVLSADKVSAALDTTYSELIDENTGTVRLLSPPFDSGRKNVGYISAYPAGVRENGGQYNHAAVFAAIAYLLHGDNERGAQLLLWLNPAIKNDGGIYGIEPYVIAGDVYTADSLQGRGGWSWYTGAAGWYRTAVINYLCGITVRGDKMYIAPRLSKVFPSYSASVKKGSTEYKIMCRISHKSECLFDGKKCKCEYFSLDGACHTVDILVCG